MKIKWFLCARWGTGSGTTRTLDKGPASSWDIDGTHVVYAEGAAFEGATEQGKGTR